MSEKKSTTGMQSLQQDEAVCERIKGTYAYTEQGSGKIKSIPVKPL
ncbi:MAG: hypothetical protein RLO80_08470 [Hyphomonas sp.]